MTVTLVVTGELHIPPQVMVEMSNIWPVWQLPTWIKIGKLSALARKTSTSWQQAGLLDTGEAEAIALAQELKADWLLTDDTAARLFASELGFEVHGSLGIVLWAAAMGQLDYSEAKETLNRLAASSLWISKRILDEAQSALEEMF